MLIECACGCGQQREQYDARGRKRKFIKGHQGQKERVFITCQHCGKESKRHPSDLMRSRHKMYFCSDTCRAKGVRSVNSISHGGDGLLRAKTEKDAAYYRKTPERIRKQAIAYYHNNRDSILKKKQETNWRLKLEMISAYGEKCECCGEMTPEFLTIDHIGGGGNAHRRRVGKGRKIYAELKTLGFPKDKYRLLCFNCNITLGFRGYCPHHPEILSGISHAPHNPGRKRIVT